MTAAQTVPIAVIRQLAVVKQGLHQRPPKADRAALWEIIRRIGLLQLDSVSVTARSHYLVMLSRAGLYDVADLDAIQADGHLFEYWAHAACLIPIEDYPHFVPAMNLRREQYPDFYRGMGDDPQQVIDHILATIREQGPLSSKDFESPREGDGGWWNWKPTKVALEYMLDYGYLMISHRVNFHRYYDLTERVLERQNFTLDKTQDDFYEWATIRSLQQQGIGTVGDIADYYRLKKTTTQQVLNTLVDRGEVIPLQVEGWKLPVYIRRDDWALMEAVAAGQHPAQVTTFLSPFDNLIWYRDRTEALFNFHYRVEMYTPAAKRRYGYYVLPVLHNGRLIGRIDPKIERKTGTFIIRALYLEPDIVADAGLVAGLRGAIAEFMAFHQCEQFVLESCEDPTLRDGLRDVSLG